MASNEKKILVQRFFDEVWTSSPEGPPVDSSGLFAPGFRYDEDPVLGPTRVSGMSQALWIEVRANRTAFPDLRTEVEKIFADEEEAAAWWRATGTHEGKVRFGMGLTRGAEVDPTGREIEATAVTRFGIADGRIAWVQTNWSPMSPLQQLAVLEGKMGLSDFLERTHG